MESNNQSDKPPKQQRHRFTREEDMRLYALVSQCQGKISWHKVSIQMKTRSAKQCRDRYYAYLFPGITNTKWTKEDDELLIQKVHEFGKKWKIIGNYFPRRGSNNIKNRWYKNLSKRLNEEETTFDCNDFIDDENDETFLESSSRPFQFSENEEISYEFNDNVGNEVI